MTSECHGSLYGNQTFRSASGSRHRRLKVISYFSVVSLGANGPVSPRRRAVCLLDSAGEPPAGDESTRYVMIGRAMGHTMYLTIVDKCASCGVMYSIATVQCYFALRHPQDSEHRVLRSVFSLHVSPENYKKLYFHREKTSELFSVPLAHPWNDSCVSLRRWIRSTHFRLHLGVLVSVCVA